MSIRDLAGNPTHVIIPGKRYVVSAEFSHPDGISSMRSCSIQLRHPDETRIIQLGLKLGSDSDSDRKTVDDGQGNWIDDGGGDGPAQNVFVSLTHAEKKQQNNSLQIRFVFWMTSAWSQFENTIEMRGIVGDVQGDSEIGPWGDIHLSYASFSLPAGGWSIIVHGKSNSVDLWPPNTPMLGLGPWAWSYQCTEWFDEQSQPAEKDSRWMWELAQKIKSLDSSRDVRIHRIRNRREMSLETWEGDRNGKYKGRFQPSNSGHNLLLFDWDDPSDYVDVGDPWRMSGFAYAAGDTLWALLNKFHIQDRIHTLIGYSRGGVVVSEASRRLLLGGLSVPQVVLIDAEGWAPYHDKEFHAWKGTRTDQYRSRVGENVLSWEVLFWEMLEAWCGGDPLPESDGNDRSIEKWPEYSMETGRIGHGSYPRYFIEWCYLEEDPLLGPVLVTPQIHSDDLGEQSIKYATTLAPTTPEYMEGRLFNGGFRHGSLAGWTYHGGLTPFRGLFEGPWMDMVFGDWACAQDRYAVKMGPLGVGSKLAHNWLVCPSATKYIRFDYEPDMLVITDKMAIGICNWTDATGTLSFALPKKRYWVTDNFSRFTRTFSFKRRDIAGYFQIGATDVECLSVVSIDDVEFIEGKPPVIGSLEASPHTVDRGGKVSLSAGNVFDPDGMVREVQFYCDVNDNEVFDEGIDKYLSSTGSGSSAKYRISNSIDEIPPGKHYFFAVAVDYDDIWSYPVRSTSQVEIISGE
jgi:hypothetical protein